MQVVLNGEIIFIRYKGKLDCTHRLYRLIYPTAFIRYIGTNGHILC